MKQESDFGAILYYGLAAFMAVAAWCLLIRLDIRKPRFSLVSLLALTLMVAVAVGIVKVVLTAWS